MADENTSPNQDVNMTSSSLATGQFEDLVVGTDDGDESEVEEEVVEEEEFDGEESAYYEEETLGALDESSRFVEEEVLDDEEIEEEVVDEEVSEEEQLLTDGEEEEEVVEEEEYEEDAETLAEEEVVDEGEEEIVVEDEMAEQGEEVVVADTHVETVTHPTHEEPPMDELPQLPKEEIKPAIEESKTEIPQIEEKPKEQEAISTAAAPVESTATATTTKPVPPVTQDTTPKISGVRAPPPPVIVSSFDDEDEDPTDETGGNLRVSEKPSEAFEASLSAIPAGGSMDEDDPAPAAKPEPVTTTSMALGSKGAVQKSIPPVSSYSMPMEEAISSNEYGSPRSNPTPLYQSSSIMRTVASPPMDPEPMEQVPGTATQDSTNEPSTGNATAEEEETVPEGDDEEEMQKSGSGDEDEEEEVEEEVEDESEYSEEQEEEIVEADESEVEVEYVEESVGEVEVESVGTSDTPGKFSLGAPSDEDLELGLPRETAPSTNKKDKKMGGLFSSRVSQILCALVTILVIAGIIVAVVVTRDNDDKARGGEPPVEPPVTMSPTTFGIGNALEASFNGPVDSQYGASVSITRASRSFIAVGAPGTGSVTLLQNTTGEWAPTQTLNAGQQEDKFGTSVSFTVASQDAGLVVGAPGVFAGGTNVKAGATHYYEYSRAQNRWNLLGSPMQGGNLAVNANEEFGASVSASDVYRVAVGAPGHNDGGVRAGRVYTFEYKQTENGVEWVPMSDQKLIGSLPGGRFGASVAISPDGTLMAAGSPLNSLFVVYEWRVDEWKVLFSASAPGGNKNEEFGASLVFLSNKHIAAGGPSANSEAGVVRVYELMGNGLFQQVGPDILGGNGQRIGALHSLTGTISEGSPAITVGTNNGMVRRFDHDTSSNEWIEIYDSVITSSESSSSSVAMITDGMASTFVVGKLSSSEMLVYTAERGIASNPLPATSAPVASPPGGSATPSPVAAPPGGNVTPSPVASSPATATPTSTPQNGSTPAPSKVTIVTSAPVSSPGTVPTPTPPVDPEDSTWTVLQTFSSNANGTGFGSVISGTQGLFAVSASMASGGIGNVQPYRLDNGSFIALDEIAGPTASPARFGEAIDVVSSGNGPSMVVGAPEADETQGFGGVPLGAAFYYELSSSGFTQVGSSIEPDATIFSANGRFGAAVSAAQTVRRIAVGAPSTTSSIEARNAGRVYTYEFDGTDWISLESTSIEGSVNGGRFGEDVAISSNGTRLLVGAPGDTNGLVLYFELANSVWRPIFSARGSTNDENFGTTVTIISGSGNTIAVGGPTYDGDRGVVRVFRQEIGTSDFKQLGKDIVGGPGDRLGSKSTLSGSSNKLVLGTANGNLLRYQFDDSADDWILVPLSQSVGSVSSVDTFADATEAIIGDAAKSTVTLLGLR